MFVLQNMTDGASWLCDGSLKFDEGSTASEIEYENVGTYIAQR